MRQHCKAMVLVGAVVMTLGLMAPSSTGAQEKLTAPIVVIIDVQRILRESLSAQSVRTQIEERRSTLRDEFAKLEKELRAAEQELARQRTVLSEEAFAEKREAYELRVTEAQRMFDTSRRQLDQSFQMALKEIQVAMFQVAEGLGTELNADLVLASSQVIFFNQDLDITDRVLERINKQLPAVKLSAEDEPEPAPGVPTQ